ncbi:MAG TPA: glycosyltransferase [Candidatus Eisenbacteria bacterium]|nr:glycosyltransferase [Candidatus Eisenbacteria bacterium]
MDSRAAPKPCARPLVSVIIPTYNRRAMVKEAIDSVLSQTFTGFELIVVDDGSTDGTVGELEAYDTRLRLISQERRGVAAARNTGARMAAGRYLAFLDSDDLWLPKKLEIQTSFMARSGDRICQTEEIWIRHGRRVNPKLKHRKPSGDVFRRSLALCLISPSAVMMTRELFENAGGFDENFRVCEDYELWLRLAAVCSVPLLPVPLVVKRGGHADQLSRSEWGLDRFRIAALVKLSAAGLAEEKRRWVADELKRKLAIFTAGARKRGRENEALMYERLVARAFEDPLYAGRRDSTVC